MATYQHIAVELSLDRGESFNVAPGYNLVAVDQSNLEIADLNNFGLGQVGQLVEVAFNNVCLAFRSR